jgi:hypothetical protein
MSSENDRPVPDDTVTVLPGEVERPGALIGSSTPTIIVKAGEVYYLTLAIWEYDRAKAEGDPAAVKVSEEVAALFHRELERKLREHEEPAVAVLLPSPPAVADNSTRFLDRPGGDRNDG